MIVRNCQRCGSEFNQAVFDGCPICFTPQGDWDPAPSHGQQGLDVSYGLKGWSSESVEQVKVDIRDGPTITYEVPCGFAHHLRIKDLDPSNRVSVTQRVMLT